MSTNQNESTPEAALEAAKQTLLQLNEALLSEAPDLSLWMTQLNTNLRQFPELIHLLSNEERAPLYRAIVHASQVKITPAVKEKKEKAPGKPKKEKLSFTQGADLFGSIDISLL